MFLEKPSENRFSTSRAIYCDVDGTLLLLTGPNLELIRGLKRLKETGFRLFLWSARGDTYAAKAAALCGCSSLFEAIIPKPGAVIDNAGWAWTKFVKILSRKDVF